MRVSQAWRKNFQSFSFRWHEPYTCMTLSFRDINFCFGYLSSAHPVFRLIFRWSAKENSRSNVRGPKKSENPWLTLTLVLKGLWDYIVVKAKTKACRGSDVGSDHYLLIFHRTVPEGRRQLKSRCAQIALVNLVRYTYYLNDIYSISSIVTSEKTHHIHIYVSIVLYWLTLQFAGAVLMVQLLVLRVDCWCATLSLFINVTSTRSSSGRWFYIIFYCITFYSSLF
jgi:hypothetical protein